MREEGTLGIIVNSDRYFGFVSKLADAATGKGKPVRIHLLGPGRKFIKTDAFARLSRLTRISLCTLSANDMATHDMDKFGNSVSLVPPQALTKILQDCSRYVVF